MYLKNKCPVYGTELTLGLIENKLRNGMLNMRLKSKSRTKIQLGAFKIEFVRTTHSIADAVSLQLIHSGNHIHTGDLRLTTRQ